MIKFQKQEAPHYSEVRLTLQGEEPGPRGPGQEQDNSPSDQKASILMLKVPSHPEGALASPPNIRQPLWTTWAAADRSVLVRANEHRQGMRVDPEATKISMETQHTNKTDLPRTPGQEASWKLPRFSMSLLPSCGPPAGNGIPAVGLGQQLLAGSLGAQPRMCVRGLPQGLSSPGQLQAVRSRQGTNTGSLNRTSPAPSAHPTWAAPGNPANPTCWFRKRHSCYCYKQGAEVCSREHIPVKG